MQQPIGLKQLLKVFDDINCGPCFHIEKQINSDISVIKRDGSYRNCYCNSCGSNLCNKCYLYERTRAVKLHDMMIIQDCRLCRRIVNNGII
jgi:NAD-dependent SIR2 family protein deacetylase